jgi:hypothetical protein
MIEIFGPTYRYNGEILTEPEIIYVSDHHYDEENHCFHVKTLLENSTCDPMQHLVVFDHINHDDELAEYNILCMPIFLATEAKEFETRNIQPNWNNKHYAFNFMINKPRLNREFLLVLIKHFGLDNYTYSLCWKKTNINRYKMLANTNSDLYKQIINNTQVDIPEKSYAFGHEVFLDQGLQSGRTKNGENYVGLLKDTLFEPSCVSLITEPSFYERETLKTEKTIMAIYGGTLPIWVGGWAIPESMRRLGFDVFDDIVDHSYERMVDPWDRAYYAVEKNLHLLRDVDRTRKFIQNNRARFQHNLDLVHRNVFMEDLVEKINRYDATTQRVLREISRGYRFRLFDDYKLLGDILGRYGPPIEETKRWG